MIVRLLLSRVSFETFHLIIRIIIIIIIVIIIERALLICNHWRIIAALFGGTVQFLYNYNTIIPRAII